MKHNPWFRMYSEAIDDEKLLLLAFEDRWHFITLLCCKNKGILDDGPLDLVWRKVAVKAGLDLRSLEEVARRLSEVGLIDQKTLQPLAWDSRQFQSDSSRERVAAFRQRKKNNDLQSENVTPVEQKQPCNVTVTVQETDTETETEKDNLSANAESGNGKPSPRKSPRSRTERQDGATCPPCPYEALQNAYREAFPTKRQPVEDPISDRRRTRIRSGWQYFFGQRSIKTGEWCYTTQTEGIEHWLRFMRWVANNAQFCMAEDSNWFDIDWLFNPTNIRKIKEGKFNRVRDAA